MLMKLGARISFCLAIASSLPSLAMAGETAFTVRALGEAPIQASALELGPDADALGVTNAGNSRTIELSKVIEIDFSGAPPASALETDADVVLIDGSRFVGRLVEGVEDSVGIEVAALGRLTIPLEQVRAIAFGADKDRPDPTTFAAADAEDMVYRRGRGDADRVSGTCTQIGKDALALASDVGNLSFKPTDLLGIVLATADVEPFPIGRAVDVDLAPSGLLRARIVSLSSGAVVLETHFKERIDIEPTRIARLRMRSDRFRYLSDLEPSAVVETPFLGTGDDFLFPFRRDVSVSGKPLFVGGVHYGKGLGVHSRSRLEWKLMEAYATFECSAGICDEVLGFGSEGSVVLRIFTDGEKVFESAVIRGGKPAIVVPPIALAGKKTLAIEFDFADRGDVGDRAALLDPLLVRATP